MIYFDKSPCFYSEEILNEENHFRIIVLRNKFQHTAKMSLKSNIVLNLDSLDALSSVVSQFREFVKYPVMLFEGDLGAGKTTLIKELITQYGCEDRGSSPSYALINNYNCKGEPIYHIDLYRLNTAEEAFSLGLEEIIYSGSKCLIEWPGLIMNQVVPPYEHIRIEIDKDGGRTIRITHIEE